jgi:hypothetical protein
MSSILSGADRQTPRRDLGLVRVGVKANAIVLAGHIAVVDTAGYAEHGKVATDLTYLGVFDETIDNTGGADGDVSVLVRTHAAFLLDNDEADAVDQASVGMKCYIHDSTTVSKTSATDTKSLCGVVLEITDEGVWVA